jgi:uncharacterized membrane protein
VTAVLAIAGVVVQVIGTWTTGREIFDAQAWIALGGAAATAALTAVASYVMRRLVAPSD